MLPARLIALQLAALLAAPLPAAPLAQYDLEPDQVLISYQVALGRYQVSGVSTRLVWSITALPDGSAQVSLRVPVESFESGHPALDLALRRALGPDSMIELDGTAHSGPLPVRFEGALRLHGVTLPFSAVLSLQRMGSRLAVRTTFTLDLDRFGVERPAQVGRTVEVDFAARLRVHPHALSSGGAINAPRTASLAKAP